MPYIASETLKRINFPCFPVIKTRQRILGTVPATSCACERSSSSMSLLKTYNCSTLTNDRLNTRAMLNVHLNLDPISDVVRKFIALGPHRLDFGIYYQF